MAPPPEIIHAESYEEALQRFGEHLEDIVAVFTDGLLSIDRIEMGPDPMKCGPALYWHVRGYSQAPVVIYSFGGLDRALRSHIGVDTMPPSSGTDWLLLNPFRFEDLERVMPLIVAYARSREKRR